MTKNYVDSKGFWSEGDGTGTSSLRVTSLATGSAGDINGAVIASDEKGDLKTVTMAQRTRWEFKQHQTASAQTFGTSHSQVFIDGGEKNEYHGLNLWNVTSSVFTPEAVNEVYTLSVQLEIEDPGGQPVLHVDFIPSGATPNDVGIFSNRFSSEKVIRTTNTARNHFSFEIPLFVTQKMVDSGSILIASASKDTITVRSASIFIKEG